MNALTSCLVLLTALGQGGDLDGDGTDDWTGAPVEGTEAPGPFGTGPIYSIDLDVLGIRGNVNSSTWEFDESVPAANGARGYLWVGDTSPSGKIIHKIDTLVPAVIASHQLTVSPEGLGWDGSYLLVQSSDHIHQVDPETGLIVNAIPTPSPGRYGISWQPGLVPTPDQYMWSTIMNGPAEQLQHFTGAVASSFPVNSYTVASLTDGKTLWTSGFGTATYYQWDMATGAPLQTLSVGFVNSNPRDGTWDGHHLWDVTWKYGGVAWQWDLYPETGLYPVTVCLNPKSITAAPGGTLVVGIGLKNHSAGTLTARILLDIFDSSNARVNDVLIKKTVDPGEVTDFHWTRPVPDSWSSGDTFKVRARLLAPTEESRAEDWTVIRVL